MPAWEAKRVGLFALSMSALASSGCVMFEPVDGRQAVWVYSPYAPGSQPNPLRIDVPRRRDGQAASSTAPAPLQDMPAVSAHHPPETGAAQRDNGPSLKHSRYVFDQLAYRFLFEQSIDGIDLRETIGCAQALQNAVRPFDRLGTLCKRVPNLRIVEFRPAEADMSGGYFVDCSARWELLAALVKQPEPSSNRGQGSTADPDPLMLDLVALEIERPSLLVHLEFNGPRRCLSRALVAQKDR